MTELNKEAIEVLKSVPETLRALVDENQKLAAALAEYRRRDQAEDIVATMEARGFSDRSVPFKDKVAQLLASEKDLGVVKEALALNSPDLSFASLADSPSAGGDATVAFEEFLLGAE